MLCTLYVDIRQDTRFLLLRRDAPFPTARYDKKDWRLLAVGVEPHNESGRAALLRDGFYEYHVARRPD